MRENSSLNSGSNSSLFSELLKSGLAFVLGLAVPYAVAGIHSRTDLIRSTLGSSWLFFLEITSLLLLPAVPVLYGWISGASRRAVLVGLLCPAGFFYYLGVFSGPAFAGASPGQIAGGLVYFGLLLLLGGLDGYFASMRDLLGLKFVLLLGSG